MEYYSAVKSRGILTHVTIGMNTGGALLSDNTHCIILTCMSCEEQSYSKTRELERWLSHVYRAAVLPHEKGPGKVCTTVGILLTLLNCTLKTVTVAYFIIIKTQWKTKKGGKPIKSPREKGCSRKSYTNEMTHVMED